MCLSPWEAGPRAVDLIVTRRAPIGKKQCLTNSTVSNLVVVADVDRSVYQSFGCSVQE